MSDQLELFASPDRPQATPCAMPNCGTTGGRTRNGVPIRYHAEKYGLDGLVCDNCRARLRRAKATVDAGFEPGVRGRRPKPRPLVVEGPPADEVFSLKPPVITPDEVAERLRALQAEHVRSGRRHVVPEDRAEVDRRRWAERAQAERRQAADSRRLSMSR